MTVEAAGLSAAIWLEIFHLCHEWRWDGGRSPAKGKKNEMIRTGYYSRLEWPEPGGVLAQSNLTVEIFRVLKDEYHKILAEKIA